MNTFRKALRVASVSACLWVPVAAVQAGLIVDSASQASHIALAAEPQYDPVGVVKLLGNSVDSSGILIAPNWVLTAAHYPLRRTTRRTHGPSAGSPASPSPSATPASTARSPMASIALHRLDAPITTIDPAQLYTGGRRHGRAGLDLCRLRQVRHG
ncbi:MAG: hypothetical protein R3C45_15055 [Phycisphaerales bacterium]